MRRATKVREKISATNSAGKKTSVGKKNISLSTMNKSRKRSFKKYRGQGK